MIGSDDMSSTSMDITESFRPEDLSKTDFFDFVTGPDLGIGVGIDRPPGNDTNGGNDQPLQGFDQFWGAEKDNSRLESAIFEDLNRYCWSQQNNSGNILNQPTNTDGQIYTLTVLNSNDQWLRKDQQADQQTTPALDFDSLLGSFPGYVKTEYSYDDSGFATDNKDDIIISQSQHHQQMDVIAVTNTINSTNQLATFQNNNNDWHMADHNAPEQETPESLLRSALQGKGYGKGLQLQNGITIIPAPNSIKTEDELRRALFAAEQDSLAFADSTLNAPLYDDNNHTVTSPNSSLHGVNVVNGSVNSDNGGVIVDDMFLTLETAFSDDYEKIKRIASEVQQFCITTDAYSEVVTQVAIQSTPQAAPEVTTTNTNIRSVTTKTTKKYKRSLNNNNNNHIVNNNNITTSRNNNNNNSNSSGNTTGSLNSHSHNNHTHSSNSNNNNNLANNNTTSTASPTQCNANGQRKERSLHYCSICSKGFKDKYSVNVHIRTHTGEKPFACSLCGKSFRQKAHLAKHYQTHLAQKNNGPLTKGKQSQRSQQQKSSTSLNSTMVQQNNPTVVASPTISQPQSSLLTQPLPQISAISSNGIIITTNR